MHIRSVCVAAAFSFLVAPTLATADVAQLGSSRDNTLYQDPEGHLSNGAGTGMFAGRSASASNSIRRVLAFFDIAASIPAGATITSATLTLSNSAANTSDTSISLHRVTEDWGEGTSVAGMGGGGGAAATAGDSTWLFRSFPGSPWATPGGSFVPGASSAAVVGGPGSYSWSGSGLVADIQAFLDAPATNFGWILLGDESASSTTRRFATREESDVNLRPMLSVEYTPVPAPGGVAVIAMLAGLGIRRRRS
jgi:hypothetical protein